MPGVSLEPCLLKETENNVKKFDKVRKLEIIRRYFECKSNQVLLDKNERYKDDFSIAVVKG